jgi:hypothetical protein
MAIELYWADTAVAAFEETDAEPDGESVFATWAEAKEAAILSAADNRDQWALCARTLRSLSKKEALKP